MAIISMIQLLRESHLSLIDVHVYDITIDIAPVFNIIFQDTNFKKKKNFLFCEKNTLKKVKY